jgi:predicted TIM-barrel fold metal-dependent hydrolase
MTTPYIVDAHQHFQDLRNSYPWLCDPDRPPQLEGDLTPIRRNYLPEDYAADIAEFPVRKTVHIENGWNARDPVGETLWLQRLAASSGRPDAIVAFADLAHPDVARLLEAHAANSALRGIRQILNWHADPMLRVAASSDVMEQPAWRRGFAALGRHDLSFDLQVYWPQMDMALALARDHPDTLLVVDHFGMPIDRSPSGIADWAGAMRRLAQAPNVFAKLSGFGLGHPSWTVDDTLPLLQRVIDMFGPERVMVGTNLPVDRLFATGEAILALITACAAEYTQTEAAALLHTTAERFYRI